ncbi:MAG: polysaccharide biosynthesis/export family protein [Chthoniobacteraceae bacterium]
MRLFTFLIPAILIALVSPASAQSAAAEPEVRRALPVGQPASAPQGGGGGAAFRVGDSIGLRLGGMPPEYAAMFSLEFTISGDGYINLPLCGQIRAAGITQSQLEKAIERKLIDEKIFTNPTAMISVPNQARFITVGGNVRAPNRQPWSSDLTLLVAVAGAGGPGDFAGDKIDLIRGGAVTTFSLKKLNKDPSQDPKMQPGDRLDLR